MDRPGSPTSSATSRPSQDGGRQPHRLDAPVVWQQGVQHGDRDDAPSSPATSARPPAASGLSVVTVVARARAAGPSTQTRLFIGVVGARMNPRVGRSRSNVTSRIAVTRAAERIREPRRAQGSRGKRPAAPKRRRRRQARGRARRRHAVAERGDADALSVDGGVQAFEVEPGRACHRRPPMPLPAIAHSWRCSRPPSPLPVCSAAVRQCGPAGAPARRSGAAVLSTPAGRLLEGLGAEVGRADRVGLVDEGGATTLVSADRQRQAERHYQCHKSKERGLKHPVGLSQCFVVTSHRPPEQDA